MNKSLSEFIQKINHACPLLLNEPLAGRCSFKTGGPADILAEPQDETRAALLLSTAHECGIPVTILGACANILVADRGIRGLVISTARLNSCVQDGTLLRCGSGLDISKASAAAADAGLAGLSFIYAMPGSVGGSVWMNARCYDHSVSDVLHTVRGLDAQGQSWAYRTKPEDFDYKISPFQKQEGIITEVVFQLAPGERDALWAEMKNHENDRSSKGHFRAPSAGSVFKNNRSFGAPSGVLIDSLGLKGHSIGGAQVAPWHANIIINKGDATSADIRALVGFVQEQVQAKLGFFLEPEIRMMGDWE